MQTSLSLCVDPCRKTLLWYPLLGPYMSLLSTPPCYFCMMLAACVGNSTSIQIWRTGLSRPGLGTCHSHGGIEIFLLCWDVLSGLSICAASGLASAAFDPILWGTLQLIPASCSACGVQIYLGVRCRRQLCNLRGPQWRATGPRHPDQHPPQGMCWVSLTHSPHLNGKNLHGLSCDNLA